MRLEALPAFLACALWTASASASNVTEFPDNGSEQLARGGAWVARASDPLAAIFNPAGLAGQRTALTVQSAIIFDHTCFTRVKAASDTTLDPLVGANGVYPRVCNDVQPTLNPQIAITYKITPRLGIGLLFIGPSSSGQKTFPDFVNDANGNPQASPQRYLVVQEGGIIAFPTVGLGYEVLDNLRIGGSLSWGFARLKLTSATLSLNADGTAPKDNDTRATLQVHDYFVPGFTLGGLYSATPQIDIAGWYKWSDAIRARGDVGTAAGYYQPQNALGNSTVVHYGDTIYRDCGTGLAVTACAGGQNATVKLPIPMEAKIGIRYHKRREMLPMSEEDSDSAKRRILKAEQHVRDPLAQDVYDIEADLTWAHDSAINAIDVRFPGDASGKGILPVAGVPGGEIPPNADQVRDYRDVVGIRVGGDYNLLLDRLAVRAGAFFESSAANAQYQDIDFVASSRFGLTVGGTYRIHVGPGDDRDHVLELMLGYGHVFFADESRTDPNASGLHGLAGTSCNGSVPIDGTQQCQDGSTRYRTKWPVNLGTITSSINVINVGAAYRF